MTSQPTKFHKKFTLVSSDSQQPPPTDAFCRVYAGFPCYSPQQIQNAYGLTPFLKAGYDGKGQTIVIIDAYGSPTIAQDLHSFDVGFGLPDPPSFKVIAPLGTVPFNLNDPWQVAWAGETTGDVESAHAMAPGANIVLLTSPVNETEGVQGLAEFLYLEKYALENNLGNIISQSWGVTENTLFTSTGQRLLAEFDAVYQQAAQQNITVLAGSGDSGTQNYKFNLKYFSFPPSVGRPPHRGSLHSEVPASTSTPQASIYTKTPGVIPMMAQAAAG